MPRTESDIPVGTQFSPALINLESFLKALCAHSGNRAELQAAVWRAPVHRKKASVPTSRRVTSLPLEAAVQYGLLEARTYIATDVTRNLVSLAGNALIEAFARHVLLKCGGLRVVEGAEQMKADVDAGLRQESVTGDSLARYLSSQGFRVTEHNTAVNSLRMWLAEAGIFRGRSWDVDPNAKRRLVGLSDDAISVLASLSETQRAFVQALCRINPPDWCKASDVRDLAESTAGVRIGRSSLPKDVLEPLKQAGLIEFRTGGTQGGKAADLKVTAEFNVAVLIPFVTETVKSLDAVLTSYYKARPEDIYAGMSSSSTFVKGQALEAYAIHVMRLLGLRFVAWRKRAKDTTGRAEIDVVLTGLLGGTPTLWQVQCKNTPGSRVDLEDVSKEVGLVPITNATHILMIANARFTSAARDFSYSVMRNSSLTIFLLDKDDYQAVRTHPGRLGAILRTRAEEIISARKTSSTWT